MDQKKLRRVEVLVDGTWRHLADAAPLFKPGKETPYGYTCPDVTIVVRTRLNGKRKLHCFGLVLVLRSGRLVNMFEKRERYRLV